MSIKDKIENAREDDWLTKDLSEEELNKIKEAVNSELTNLIKEDEHTVGRVGYKYNEYNQSYASGRFVITIYSNNKCKYGRNYRIIRTNTKEQLISDLNDIINDMTKLKDILLNGGNVESEKEITYEEYSKWDKFTSLESEVEK